MTKRDLVIFKEIKLTVADMVLKHGIDPSNIKIGCEDKLYQDKLEKELNK